MKTYIYGENFIKTKKNLYCIKSYNMVTSDKIVFDFYIAVNSFSDQRGKTNSFTYVDGNFHLRELREASYNQKPILFNRIKENTRLYNALKNRINF